MKWESLGFSGNPFNTDPITRATLPLFTGHEKSIAVSKNVLSEKNVLMIVEGARGVGTTSFGNYLRFSSQSEKNYFTPDSEIRVGKEWSLETLLSVIIANTVREIELSELDIIKDKRFQDAKALSLRIAETYRSFGISVFGVGANYGKSGGASQPIIVPGAVLGHHLADLAHLIHAAGYQYGLLLQLNNLDIGEIHDEKHLKVLFNELRDYIQTNYVSWLLIGDTGLRRFIAQHVDRLDDIVSYEIEIKPLDKAAYEKMIERRSTFYRSHAQAELPIDKEVLLYLFDLTKGRLRYVFGLLKRLINDLSIGDLSDRLTLQIAKPMVVKLAKERLAKNSLTTSEKEILKTLVTLKTASGTELSTNLNKPRQNISRALVRLTELNLVTAHKTGRNKIYTPVLDAMIAYSE